MRHTHILRAVLWLAATSMLVGAALLGSTSALAATGQNGYAATDFITGFPRGGCCSLGPLGIAFGGGQVFVANGNGSIYHFSMGGGAATPSSILNALPGVDLRGLAFGRDGKLYLSAPGYSGGDAVVEINPNDGTVVRVVARVANPHGVATDPISGDLFVSAYADGRLTHIVNPSSPASTSSTYAVLGQGSDGVATGADGTIYVANATTGSIFRVSSLGSPTPGTVSTVAVVGGGPDGLAISTSAPTFLVANRNDGNISKIDLATGTQTVIVTGGSRGDFASVGPDGCLYATQIDSILKVTRADGTCDLLPTRPPDATATSVTCSPLTVPVGSPTTCTVTVSDTVAAGSSSPSGTVALSSSGPGTFAGPCVLAPAPPTSQSSCVVSYTPSAVGSGVHTITAAYPGDLTHVASSGSAAVTVVLAPTTTTVHCTPDPVTPGAPTTCTGTVGQGTGAGPVPATGTVTFSSSGAGAFSSPSCTLTASASCSVTYTPATVGTGTHLITGSYGGDAAHAASSGTFPLGVVYQPTSTSLSCTPTSVTAGSPVACTVTVGIGGTGTITAPTAPTGSVALSSSGPGSLPAGCALIGSGSTASCSFTYTPSGVGTGTHTITAAYPGDSSHAPSSGVTAIVVSYQSTATGVTCAPPSPTVGTPTTCTATVTATAGGTGVGGSPTTPTGTVGFTAPGGALGTSSCTLAGTGSSASCSVVYTPANQVAQVVTAAYGGDPAHSPSTGTATVTATARPTGTSVSCAPSTVVVGVPSTCTATVTDSGPGAAGTPTGTVAFTHTGAGTLSAASCALTGAGSTASCSVTFTPTAAGTATVTATYGGDPTHSSSSATASLTVTAATSCGSGGHDGQEGDNHQDGRDLRHSEGSLRNHQNHQDQDGGDCNDKQDQNNHQQGGDDHSSAGHQPKPPPRRERESD